MGLRQKIRQNEVAALAIQGGKGKVIFGAGRRAFERTPQQRLGPIQVAGSPCGRPDGQPAGGVAGIDFDQPLTRLFIAEAARRTFRQDLLATFAHFVGSK